MSYKIADCMRKAKSDETYKSKLESLKLEKNEMYNGNQEIIDKILNVYSKDIKEIYNKK